MYEELVKQLRHPWQYNGLIADLTNSAADAIDELSKQVEKWEEIADIWRAAYAGLEHRVYPKMYPKPPKRKN